MTNPNEGIPEDTPVPVEYYAEMRRLSEKLETAQKNNLPAEIDEIKKKFIYLQKARGEMPPEDRSKS